MRARSSTYITAASFPIGNIHEPAQHDTRESRGPRFQASGRDGRIIVVLLVRPASRDPRVPASPAFAQPVVDRRRHFALGATGHVDADVAALERQFGVVAGRRVLQRERGAGGTRWSCSA